MRSIELYQIEIDVIGSMLINGDMTVALLSDLHSQDFRFEKNRTIYKAMKQLQHYGKFETTDLLTNEEKGKQNMDIINLMDGCLMTNIDVKCRWLLKQSHNLHIGNVQSHRLRVNTG